MTSSRVRWILQFVLLICVALLMTGQTRPDSCPIFEPPTPTPPNSDLQWYQTCGDPVCSGFQPSGNGLCTTQAAGDVCSPSRATCDLDGNMCNVRLLCTDTDPTTQPGGCPISRKAFKTDIDYIDEAERAVLAAELLNTPLATYRYKGAERTNLGFIIEDVEPSLSVYSELNRVDLYAYTTMAVATLQEQAKQIEALKAELAAMKLELEAVKK